MPLVQLTYASRAPGATLSEITDMLNLAKKKNAELGITGLLVFDSRFFLQLLEGERERVNALYRRICRDPRHSDVTLLTYREIGERTFGDWAMGYVSYVDADTLARHSDAGRFDPFALEAARVLPLLEELAKPRPA